MKRLSIIILFSCCWASKAQTGYSIYRMVSSHTSFPDTARANGHLYNTVLYDAATHYNDNSVLMIVPANFRRSKKTDMIFWFHGWGNNIDSALARYDLVQQFLHSALNAVLVLAETAKDAPDSYGGKLETPGEFKELVTDIMLKLKQEKVISRKTETGNVWLAGHSGAYRVMAYILENGKVPVKKVMLFDALYGETEKYMKWIKEDTTHRFINIYTDGGGTDAESRVMVKKLTGENIPVYNLEETQLGAETLQQHRIVVIHSLHKHNDVIKQPDNFTLFLRR